MTVVSMRSREQPQPTVSGRLLTDQMAVRAWARRHLQPQATRLACCYWWPTHDLRDAQVELRLALLRLLRAAGHDHLTPTIRAFADDVLQEAIDAVGKLHADSFEALSSVAAGARRAGASSLEVTKATLKVARRMVPLPPPGLVQEAIDGAKLGSAPAMRWLRRRPLAHVARHHA